MKCNQGLRRLLATLCLVTFALIIAVAAGPASAADCTGPLVEPAFYAGNPVSLGYRIESPRGTGSFDVVLAGARYIIHWEVYEANTRVRFWEADGRRVVTTVVVKASDAFIYSYSPAVAADCRLRAPDNPGGQIPTISHIDFAFEAPDEDLPGRIVVDKSVIGDPDRSGFSFSLERNTDGTWQPFGETLLTGEAGVVQWADLPPGTFRVLEAPRDGWVFTSPADGIANVELAPGATAVVSMVNTKLGTITLAKSVAGDGDPAGFVFSLERYVDGVWTSVSPARTTEGDGQVTWTDLMAGLYRVTEATRAGWICTSPAGGIAEVELAPGQDAVLSFANAKLGSITVRKFAAGGEPLAGAAFELWQGGTLLDTQLLEGRSTHTWTDLAAGEYLVIEIAPPIGYRAAEPADVPVVLGDAQMSVTVDFHNEPIESSLGSITVRKFDPDGGALSGARFALWRGETKIDERTLPGHTYTWELLPLGDYRLVEVTAPAGWLRAVPSTKAVVIGDQEGQTRNAVIDFTNRRATQDDPGALTVTKYTNTNAPLSGATFALYRGQDRIDERTLTGHTYTWTGLTPGDYTVVEVAAPAGWLRETAEQSVTVMAGGQSSVSFFNRPLPLGSITVQKYDNTGQPLSGAVFSLWRDGARLDERQLSGFTHTWSGLAAGTYQVVEIAPPAGYAKASPETVTVTLTLGPSGVSSETVRFRNPPAPGSITVVKLFVDVVDGSTSPLSGATFALYRPDQAGGKLDERTLSGHEHTWDGLAPGAYTVVEVRGPNRPGGGTFDPAAPVTVVVPPGQNVRVEIFNELPRTGGGHWGSLGGLILLLLGLVVRQPLHPRMLRGQPASALGDLRQERRQGGADVLRTVCAIHNAPLRGAGPDATDVAVGVNSRRSGSAAVTVDILWRHASAVLLGP